MFKTISIKIPDILHRNRKINPEIHTEIKKTLNSQSNSEQKIQCWRHQKTQLQTVLQTQNNFKKQHSIGTKTDRKTSGSG
jgi:hypothetical protein